jgi:hypothetical protein
MRKKAFFDVLALALAVLVVLPLCAACGGTPSGDDGTPSDDVGSPTEILGRVITGEATGIAGVNVTVLAQEISAVTDEAGYFSLTGVSSGLARVSLSKGGFVRAVIFAEAEQGESVTVGEIVLPSSFGEVITVEELTQDEYQPTQEAADVLQNYLDLGFELAGILRVTLATGEMHVTALTKGVTQSAFVLDSNGASGILLDFTDRTKELIFADSKLVLKGPFGEEMLPLLKGSFHEEMLPVFSSANATQWGSEIDKEEFEKLFLEKEKTKNAASDYKKKVKDISEDLATPSKIKESHGISNTVVTGLEEAIETSLDLKKTAEQLEEAVKEAAEDVKKKLEDEANSLTKEKEGRVLLRDNLKRMQDFYGCGSWPPEDPAKCASIAQSLADTETQIEEIDGRLGEIDQSKLKTEELVREYS